MSREDGYKPRHKGVINWDFCLNGCVTVDGIKVPFPDCFVHGNPFITEPDCAIIRSLAH